MNPKQSFFPLTSRSNFQLIKLFLLTICLFGATCNFALGQELPGRTFIIAPGGSDNNPGILSQPMATLEAARDAARSTQPGKNRIVMMPGEYYLTKPVELDARDNGLTIEADPSGTVILYGGIPVTGWKRDGKKFWYADLPGVKEGTWDFRALVVEGRMPERARIPASGTLLSQNVFDVPWLSSIAGGWARQPTEEELTTLRYNPKDIPETLDIKNAEIRVYHMWDESLVGVARNDIQHHTLQFSKPPIYPSGGFGKNDYVIWNTREGMTQPGRWYLDRTAGRLVYWPLEGEDMSSIKIIAPKTEYIIRIAGEPARKAEKIILRGLKLQATTIPFRSAGMGATSFNGAISLINTSQCKLEGLEISNAGGIGILATQMTAGQITDCHIHNIGGAGARIDGDELFFARNHLHHVGIYYPGAVGLSSNGNNNHIYRNEIHDVPYSGMLIGETNILIEENLIYRVMREIHDGAAIYTFGVSNCILRGNVARDITESGAGYGVSSYYLDEGSHDCIVEKNISKGVTRPVHNHIARNSIIRDNVFISNEDMDLSFQASANFTFEHNTLIANGKINITQPNAITSWKDNKIFSNGRDKNNTPQAFTIDSAMPASQVLWHKTDPIPVTRCVKAPSLDGDLAPGEWAGEFQRLDRNPSREQYSGAPVLVKFSYDQKFLYIGAIMTMFETENIRKGNSWGKDDAVEISIGGLTDQSKPMTYVIRTYVDGTIQSITDAGADESSAVHLGKGVQFVSKIAEEPRKGWSGEWAIPLEALGLKPTPELKVLFNMCAYVNEYEKWHCWEGTLGDSWQVSQAGTLLLK